MYPAPYGQMAQAMRPAPYGPVPPAMYPPNPYGPVQQGALLASYPRQGQASTPATLPATLPAADEISGQLLKILHDSVYPSERERAVDALANRDWRANPQVVDALVKAAREDPAATVRAACVRGLGQMHANTMPVVTVVQALKADPDPRVKKEAEQALVSLGVSSTPGTASPIQPVSAVNPK
jgi:hypothetical protein